MSNRSQQVRSNVQVCDGDGTAIDHLAEASGLSRQQLKQALVKGAVWWQQGAAKPRRLRRASRLLQKGDQLYLYYDSAILQQQPPAARLIADEGSYSVWFKPAGMYCEGSRWGDHCTIVRWAEQHLRPQRNAFLVHRLDRAASGLLLLAHGKRSAADLAALFRERTVDKRYRVQVVGEFPATPEPLNRESPLDGKAARSHFTRVTFDAAADRSVLEVQIESGRKHQIRRHLAELGYPVVGDRLYGEGKHVQDLQLQACYLAFKDPLSGEPRTYVLAEKTGDKAEADLLQD